MNPEIIDTIQFIITIIAIFGFAGLMLYMILTPVDTTWNSKDMDDTDKQYGYMCYKCEISLEDGKGEPRLCEKCKK